MTVERRKLERRAKVNRRRQIDPTTCERDYTADEVEFMNSLEQYKRTSGRMFPTCSEILEVIRGLGYEKRSPAIAEAASDTAPNADAEPDSDADANAASDANPDADSSTAADAATGAVPDVVAQLPQSSQPTGTAGGPSLDTSPASLAGQ